MQGVAHLRTGDCDVWCLSDGDYVFDNADFASVDDDLRAKRLADAGLPAIETVFHAYLIKPAAGGLILFDTGCGDGFGPKAGHLMQRLAALDVAADDIETLVFSHLHSDHCGGAVRDGAPVFGRARAVVHEAEPATWDGGDYAANRTIAAYAPALVGDAAQIADGIVTWALPGHTAGHMGLRVGAELVLCADILHSDALQLPDPEVASVHDDDPVLARATRAAALAEIAAKNLIFSGSHGANVPKFRRLRAAGTAYEWTTL